MVQKINYNEENKKEEGGKEGRILFFVRHINYNKTTHKK